MLPPPPSRASQLARLATETFDALVVGAGATGAAIARDAALRGLKVALCDRGDYGGETSSHSSKLIHGGLRYLEQGNLPLVFEALTERRRLLHTAPHLCRPVEFFFPAYAHDGPSLTKLAIGVTLYDALALWRPPVRSRRLAAAAVHAEAPLLRTDGLRGAMGYVDCQTDDTRLVLENVLDAEIAGAAVASYVSIERPRQRRRFFHEVAATDRSTGARFTITTRAVVNATGPFSDAFRGRGDRARALRPTLGVHIVVDAQRLPTLGHAFVIRSPRDGRIMFVLPDGLRTVVGTTDTDWPGVPGPGAEIRARGEDIVYLLEAANHAFPDAGLRSADVLSTFAGLRPLLASDDTNPSASSREHAIWITSDGVLTIAGGKLTTMRRMGEETTDRLVELLAARGYDGPVGPCVTAERALPGGEGWNGSEGATLAATHELGDDVVRHLVATYGARAHAVAALIAEDARFGRRLIPELPHLVAEVPFAIRFEHAREVEDVLARRVPLFRLDRDQGETCAELVADHLAYELGAYDRQRGLESYRARVGLSRRWKSELRATSSATSATNSTAR